MNHSDQIDNKSGEFVAENCHNRNKLPEFPKIENDDTIDSTTMDYIMGNSTSKDRTEFRWDKTLINSNNSNVPGPTKDIFKFKNDEKVESPKDQTNNGKCEFCRDFPKRRIGKLVELMKHRKHCENLHPFVYKTGTDSSGCKFCNTEFERTGNLFKHIENQHCEEIEVFNEKFMESNDAYICLLCDQNKQKIFDTKILMFDHIFVDHKKNSNEPVDEISEYEKIREENIAKQKASLTKLFPEKFQDSSNKKSKPKSKHSPASATAADKDLQKIQKRISKSIHDLKENVNPKIKKRKVSSNEINHPEPKLKNPCIRVTPVKIPEPGIPVKTPDEHKKGAKGK